MTAFNNLKVGTKILAAFVIAFLVMIGIGLFTLTQLNRVNATIDDLTENLAVDRQIRACTPAPGAWTTFRGDRVKLQPVRRAAEAPEVAPGQLLPHEGQWLVGTGTRGVLLDQVQPAGKRAMPAADWLRGVRPAPDERFE